MAELFRARSVGAQGFSKVLALKRILPELAGDESFAAMLIDEARVVANLSHPNIVQVFELGKDLVGYYIAMELVNGPNLASILIRLRERGRRLPEPLALEIVIQVLQALDLAHRYTDAAGRPLGIVHRDVSPQNILVSDAGAVKLGDFGIAKAANRVSGETRHGGIKGKFPYMAPEQVRGGVVDGRTDQFAAALVLWECLAGEMHYTAENDMALLWKAGEAKIRPLTEAGVSVSPELEAILSRALQKEPEARFPSCGDFARALTAYDRRTYPAHDPGALAALVRTLFDRDLQESAERLRRIEEGLEPSWGWAGVDSPIPLVSTFPGASQAVVSSPAAADLTDELIDPTLVRTQPGDDEASLADTLPSRSAVEISDEERKRAAQSQQSRERVSPPRMTAEELAAIEQALEADRKAGSTRSNARPARSKPEPQGAKTPVPTKTPDSGKTSGRTIGAWAGLVGAFALAACGVWFGLDMLEGAGRPEPIVPVAVDSEEVEGEVDVEPRAPKSPKESASRPGRETERTSARQKSRAAEAQQFGTLDLTCIPADCSIVIDGRDTGLIAPAKGIVLTAGRHRVRVVNETLNLSKTVSVEVAADQSVRLDFNLVLDP